jgi:hypothetical protein
MLRIPQKDENFRKYILKKIDFRLKLHIFSMSSDTVAKPPSEVVWTICQTGLRMKNRFRFETSLKPVLETNKQFTEPAQN